MQVERLFTYSPTSLEQERTAYLDLLRMLATLGVVFLHVSGMGFHLPVGEYNWYVAVVGDSLVRWSVPVFVMISGALFLKPDKKITIRLIMMKYIKRLLCVYLFWCFAYMCFKVTILSIGARTFVFNQNCVIPYFHLWFLPMLMGVYLLIPFLRKVTLETNLLKYALLLWLVYLTVSFVLVRDIPQISPLFKMNLIVGYTGYFLLGFYMSIATFSKGQKGIIYSLGVMGLLITVFGSIMLSFYKGVDDEKFLFNISPQVVMMSTAVFLLIKEIAPKVKKCSKKAIEYIRKDLFGIYLVHGFWLYALNRAYFRDMTNQIVTLPLITITVFVLSFYSTKIIRKIPYLKKMVE